MAIGFQANTMSNVKLKQNGTIKKEEFEFSQGHSVAVSNVTREIKIMAGC